MQSINDDDFPSFSEGLSLRALNGTKKAGTIQQFPFLFGGTFIEGLQLRQLSVNDAVFPFLFGGTFIEGL